MKKILTVMLSVIAVFVCALMLFACGNSGNVGNTPPVDDDPPITVDPPVDNEDNKLYEKRAGVYYNDYFEDEYIVLTVDHIWYDNTGLTGKYAITKVNDSRDDVFLYADLTDNQIEYANGYFLSSLVLSSSSVYSKMNVDIPECPKSLEYELSDDETYYAVTGIGEVTGDVTIPLRYKMTPVKEISDRAFMNVRTLTSIRTLISATHSVEKIGEHAFENCVNLTSVKIVSDQGKNGADIVYYHGVTELAEETFSGCTKLQDIYLPATLTKIGYRAFKDCEKVKNVYYGSGLEKWAEDEVKKWAKIDFGISDTHASSDMGSDEAYWQNPISGRGRKLIIGGTTVTSCALDSVSAGAFFQYEYLTSVKSLPYVGDYAFYYSGISSLDAKKGVVHKAGIGKSACEGCSNLQSFSVSHSNSNDYATYIEESAFANCVELTSVSLDHTVRVIGEYAFAFCEKLTDIEIPDKVLRIEKYAFSESGLERADFKSKSDWIVKTNNEQYVSVCGDQTAAARLLTSRTNGYTAYKWDLSGLVFELSDDGSYYKALIDYMSPSHIDIPSSYKGKPVANIGRARNDFGTMYAIPVTLKSIYIPSSITSINTRFGSLSVIYCEAANRPSGWDSWFNYTNNYQVMKPTIWNCKSNDKDRDGYAYTEIDGVIYRLKDKVAEAYKYVFNADDPKNLVMPQYISYKEQEYALQTINVNCFTPETHDSNLWLDSVVIPNGVTTIGSDAFKYTSISYLEIPSSVVSIGTDAFFLGYYQGTYIGHIKFNGTRTQWDAAIKDVNTTGNGQGRLVVECIDQTFSI